MPWPAHDNISLRKVSQSYFACWTQALNLVSMGETPESCLKLYDHMLKKLVAYKQVLISIANAAKEEFDSYINHVVK